MNQENQLRTFKNWLQNEAKFDPSISLPKIRKWNDKSHLDYDISLTMDKDGNVVPYDFTTYKPHLTLHPKNRTVDLQKLSPQSSEFHKIIKAVANKYTGIENWTVNHFFMAGHMQSASDRARTVKFWLSRPEIRLANKIPKYLYHGTSTNLWYEGIQQKGLVPRGLSGSSGSYGSQNVYAISHDDLVYLSTDPDAATREAAIQASNKHGGKPLIVRISTTGMNPNLFRSDEDTKADTPQKSVDISSTLAYQGKIPNSNLEPFLLGGLNPKSKSIIYNWTKFHDVPIEEHPITQKLRKGQPPYNGEPAYYALKDAGIIKRIKRNSDSGWSSEEDVVNDPETISDAKIKNILKNSGWVTTARLIMQDLNNGPRGTLYQLQHELHPLEIASNPVIKMLVDSELFTVHEIDGKSSFRYNSWKQEQGAIALAKMLGKKGFNYLIDSVKKITSDD